MLPQFDQAEGSVCYCVHFNTPCSPTLQSFMGLFEPQTNDLMLKAHGRDKYSRGGVCTHRFTVPMVILGPPSYG